jgi:hypothetical protein
MTAVVLVPANGRWTWDARGEGRAVRVTTHTEDGLLNLSLWRGETCAGTARLAPGDVADLIGGLTEGLAALAARPRVVGAETTRVAELEARLAALEQRRQPLWRRGAGAVTGWAVRRAVRASR